MFRSESEGMATSPTLGSLQAAGRMILDASRYLAFAGVVGMLFGACVTVGDVLARWLWNGGIAGLNEVISMFFSVAIVACLPAGLAAGVNLKVDLLADWIKGRVAVGLDAFGHFLLLVFFGILTQQLWAYAGQLAEEGRITVILQWRLAPFMYAIALLLAYATVVQTIMLIRSVAAVVLYVGNGEDQSSPLMNVIVSCMCFALLLLAIYCAFDFEAVSAFVHENAGTTLALAFVIMWVLMLILIPLAAVMGMVGIFCSALFIGFQPALSAFASEATRFLTYSEVATLPLFLMMGSFAAISGLSDDLYKLAHLLLARFRGGLALATIGGCAGFGALTGSSLATAVTIGRVAIPEMRARGYSAALATGACAAGGTLGPIVPPGSGPIILFALLTEASIGQLFIASVGPAILTVLFYFIVIMIYVRVAKGSSPELVRVEKGEVRAAAKRSTMVAVLVLVVMGGLYLGIFTAVESAAVGAVGAFIAAGIRGKLKRHLILDVMQETTATTAMVYALIFGASIFSFFVSVSALTEAVTAYAQGLHWPPALLVCAILLIYVLLGSIMESFAILVITVPIVTPLILGMGYDLIWWGILMLIVIEIGMISPPLGLNVLVLKGILPDVKLGTIYKGVLPFYLADIIKMIILVLIPAITLWLPSTMR